MSTMRMARGLVVFSAAVFAGIGLAYLIAPGAMLAIVGVASIGTSDFLMRTEGVALLCGGGLLWAVRNGIVGFASVPSAAVRVVVGVICLLTAARLPASAGR